MVLTALVLCAAPAHAGAQTCAQPAPGPSAGSFRSALAGGPRREFVAEAGAMSLRQRDGGAGTARAVSLQARSLWTRAALDVNATLVGTADESAGSATSASLLAAGGDVLWPGTERARLEVVGAYTSFGAFGSRQGAQRSVMARQHVQVDGSELLGGLSAGGFAGAGVARAERLEFPARATTVEAGGWLARGALSAAVVAQRSTSTDWQLIEASGYALRWPAAAYQVQDVRVNVRAQRAAFELYAGAAWRGSMGGTTGSSRVAQLGASWQVTPQWSLVGGTGRHLADLLRGTPELRQHMLMLRWQHAPWRAVPASFGGGAGRVGVNADGTDAVRRSRGDTTERAVEVQLLAHASGAARADSASGVLLVRLPAAGAERAEVTGSFNDWQPLAMTREGAHFTVRVPVPRGPHRVAVRCDGGVWRAPWGTARVDDGFGGESGLVVVPE